MDATHLRGHLTDLRGRIHFLRTLRPDSDRYKLWLGDLIEFINVAYGPDSPALAEARAILLQHGRLPTDAPNVEREQHYLARLVALDAFLAAREGEVRDPLVLVEEWPGRASRNAAPEV